MKKGVVSKLKMKKRPLSQESQDSQDGSKRYPGFPPPLPGHGYTQTEMDQNLREAMWQLFWQENVDKQIDLFMERPNLGWWIQANYGEHPYCIRDPTTQQAISTTIEFELPQSFPPDVDPYFTLNDWFQSNPEQLQGIETAPVSMYKLEVGPPPAVRPKQKKQLRFGGDGSGSLFSSFSPSSPNRSRDRFSFGSSTGSNPSSASHRGALSFDSPQETQPPGTCKPMKTRAPLFGDSPTSIPTGATGFSHTGSRSPSPDYSSTSQRFLNFDSSPELTAPPSPKISKTRKSMFGNSPIGQRSPIAAPLGSPGVGASSKGALDFDSSPEKIAPPICKSVKTRAPLFGGSSGFDSSPERIAASGGFDSSPERISASGGFDSSPERIAASGGFDSSPERIAASGGFDSSPERIAASGGFDSSPERIAASGGFDSSPERLAASGGFDSSPERLAASGGFDSSPERLAPATCKPNKTRAPLFSDSPVKQPPPTCKPNKSRPSMFPSPPSPVGGNLSPMESGLSDDGFLPLQSSDEGAGSGYGLLPSSMPEAGSKAKGFLTRKSRGTEKTSHLSKMSQLSLEGYPQSPRSLTRRAVGSAAATGAQTDETNKNPFSPVLRRLPENDFSAGPFKRLFAEVERGGEYDERSPKKVFLNDENTRYQKTFVELAVLGQGEFGKVSLAKNRLDGQHYAIKVSKLPIAGTKSAKNALKEVFAHAVLGQNIHIVRYFSAWTENKYMYIQNEFCNGGSLEDAIENNRRKKVSMTENDMKQQLFHIGEGLAFMHSLSLAHLDLKPGNIFVHITKGQSNADSPDVRNVFQSPYDQGPFTADFCLSHALPIYKIGDLGHVTNFNRKIYSDELEEGDCRYMSAEMLMAPPRNLPKCDIFSLGMTVIESGTSKVLPKNGAEWEAYRRGQFQPIPHCSHDMNALIAELLHPAADQRLSAASLINHHLLNPSSKRENLLRMALNEEKFKNSVLNRKLEQMTPKKKISPPRKPAGVGDYPEEESDRVVEMPASRYRRKVGGHANRTMSLNY